MVLYCDNALYVSQDHLYSYSFVTFRISEYKTWLISSTWFD